MPRLTRAAWWTSNPALDSQTGELLARPTLAQSTLAIVGVLLVLSALLTDLVAGVNSWAAFITVGVGELLFVVAAALCLLRSRAGSAGPSR